MIQDREQLCTFKFSVALRPQRPRGLLRTGSPGRPPRLSRSCGTLKTLHLDAASFIIMRVDKFRLWPDQDVQHMNVLDKTVWAYSVNTYIPLRRALWTILGRRQCYWRGAGGWGVGVGGGGRDEKKIRKKEEDRNKRNSFSKYIRNEWHWCLPRLSFKAPV